MKIVLDMDINDILLEPHFKNSVSGRKAVDKWDSLTDEQMEFVLNFCLSEELFDVYELDDYINDRMDDDIYNHEHDEDPV